jgi:fructokinase
VNPSPVFRLGIDLGGTKIAAIVLAPDELPGPACYCGRFGCLETWLSGPGLAEDYHRRGGERSTSEQILAHVGADPRAAATLRAWTSRLARGLASVINVLDPDVIVIGGGLSQVASLYRDVPAIWSEWVFSDVVTTRLVSARYGDASGVRGAAWLWA